MGTIGCIKPPPEDKPLKIIKLTRLREKMMTLIEINKLKIQKCEEDIKKIKEQITQGEKDLTQNKLSYTENEIKEKGKNLFELKRYYLKSEKYIEFLGDFNIDLNNYLPMVEAKIEEFKYNSEQKTNKDGMNKIEVNDADEVILQTGENLIKQRELEGQNLKSKGSEDKTINEVLGNEEDYLKALLGNKDN